MGLVCQAPEFSLDHHAPWVLVHPISQEVLRIQHTGSDALSSGYLRLQLGKPQ